MKAIIIIKTTTTAIRRGRNETIAALDVYNVRS
jgi:hypothetical protein